jgi:hypothetical protein
MNADKISKYRKRELVDVDTVACCAACLITADFKIQM